MNTRTSGRRASNELVPRQAYEIVRKPFNVSSTSASGGAAVASMASGATRSGAITNAYRDVAMIRDTNTFYANIQNFPNLRNSLANTFYTKAVMGVMPANKRAAYIPPNDPGLYFATGDDTLYYSGGLTPNGRPNFQYYYPTPSPRSLLGAIFGGIFGDFKPPVTQNSSITFTTSVSESIQFRNSIQSLNQTIADFVLKQSQISITDISELANFNIVGLNVSEQLSLTINSTQSLTFINVGKIDAKVVNQFVLQTSTQIFNDILNDFEAKNIGSLNLLNKAQSNSNLIQSLLNTNSPNDVNINTVINNNNTVSTAYKYEKDAVFQTISKNSQINEFAQRFQNSIAQVLNINLTNITVGGKADIVLSNTQHIEATIDIITKLDLASSTFNSINTSDTFKIDQSVFSDTKTEAQSTTSQAASTETLSDLASSAGSAIGGVINSAGSILSTSLATIALPSILIAGGIGLFLAISAAGARSTPPPQPTNRVSSAPPNSAIDLEPMN